MHQLQPAGRTTLTSPGIAASTVTTLSMVSAMRHLHQTQRGYFGDPWTAAAY